MSVTPHETLAAGTSSHPLLGPSLLGGREGWRAPKDHHNCWARRRGSEPLAGIFSLPGRTSHAVAHPAYKYSQTAHL